MQKIYIKNTLIDFDGRLKLTINYPVDNSEMSATLPVKIPLTDVNMPVFSKREKTYPARIDLGIVVLDAELTVNQYTNVVDGYFFINNDFYKTAKNKKLADIDWGELMDLTADGTLNFFDQAKATITNSVGADDKFAFPFIVNDKKTEGWPGIIPPVVRLNVENITAAEGSDLRLFIPFLYLNYIIKNIAWQSGLRIVSNSFNDNDALRRLLLFNNYSLAGSIAFVKVASYASLAQRVSDIVQDDDDTIVTLVKPAVFYDTHPYVTFTGAGSSDLNNSGALLYSLIDNETYKIKIPNRTFDLERFVKTVYVIRESELKITSYYYNIIGGEGNNIILCEFPFRFDGRNWDYQTPKEFNLFDAYDQPVKVPFGGYSRTCKLYRNDTLLGEVWAYYSAENKILLTGFPEGFVWIWAPTTYYMLVNDFPWARVVVDGETAQFSVESINTVANFDMALKSTLGLIDIKNHLPNINIAEFIEHLENQFGLYFFVSPFSKNVKIQFFTDVLASEPIDISAYVEKAQLDSMFEQKGYKVVWADDSTDQWWADKVKERFVSSIKEMRYIGSFSVLPASAKNNDYALKTTTDEYWIYRKEFLSNNGAWEFLTYRLNEIDKSENYANVETYTLPITPAFKRDANSVGVDTPMNCDFIAELKNECELRMFFQNGVTNNIPQTDHKTTGLSLDLAASDSIYKKHLEPVMYWRTKLKYDKDVNINLPLHILMQIDGSRKLRADNYEFIVKKIEIESTVEAIEYGKTTLMRV